MAIQEDESRRLRVYRDESVHREYQTSICCFIVPMVRHEFAKELTLYLTVKQGHKQE